MAPTQPEKKKTKISEEEEQFVEKKDGFLNPTTEDDDWKKMTKDEEDEEDEEDEDDEDDEHSMDSMDSYEKRYRAIPLPYSEEDEDWNNEEFQNFIKTFNDTDGYIVPETSQGVAVSAWRPCRVCNKNPYVVHFSRLALDSYMDNNSVDKEKYEFKEVKHANKGSARGILYHLVFVARVVGTGEETLFKAKVLSGIDEEIVQACELAPDLLVYC